MSILRAPFDFETSLRLLRTCTLLAGLACAGSAWSQQVAAFQCVSGDCVNGQGTAQTADGVQYSGLFQGARFADTTYQVRYPGLPTQTFPMRFSAASQKPVEGTQIRGNIKDAMFGYSKYEGQFGIVHNPFVGADLATFSNGRYTSNVGVVYEGEFEYVPVRFYSTRAVMGVFIFLGARIDKEFDEVRQGLYISEPFAPGGNIMFKRARADYITVLRSEYQLQANQAATDRASDERSAAAFGMFMDVLGGMSSLKSMKGGAFAGSLGGSTRSTMGLLRGAMTGQQGTEAALNGILGQLQTGLSKSAGVNDPLIQGLATGDIKGMLRDLAKQGVKQTLKEYENSLKPTR
jgi:hypothetical protein